MVARLAGFLPGGRYERGTSRRCPVAVARMGRVTTSTAGLWHHYGRTLATSDRAVPGTSS